MDGLGRCPDGGQAFDLFRQITYREPPQFYRLLANFYIRIINSRKVKLSTMSESNNNKPVEVFRRRGIKVSVFQNQSGDQFFHKIAVQKVYRDGDNWKTTSTLGRDDLPVARLLIGHAWEFILDRESKPENQNTPDQKETSSVDVD